MRNKKLIRLRRILATTHSGPSYWARWQPFNLHSERPRHPGRP